MVVLCIKGGFTGMPNGPNNTPEGVRASVEEAVRVLDGTKAIDIFECARVDPQVPVETTVKALDELVKEGKIHGIGLSEVNANTIRKAHAVHPISSVEIELSLFTPEPLHNGIADTCHERKRSLNNLSVGRAELTLWATCISQSSPCGI